MNLVPAYIALGSNLSDPVAQVMSGVEALAMMPDSRLALISSLYRTAPVGYLDQPPFVNAVAMVETALEPRALLAELLAIERRHGRVRDVPNGPRTLDLDILLYGDSAWHDPELTIPHPRMSERAFVLVPLAEVGGEVVVPGHATVRELAARVDTAGIQKIDSER